MQILKCLFGKHSHSALKQSPYNYFKKYEGSRKGIPISYYHHAQYVQSICSNCGRVTIDILKEMYTFTNAQPWQ